MNKAWLKLLTGLMILVGLLESSCSGAVTTAWHSNESAPGAAAPESSSQDAVRAVKLSVSPRDCLGRTAATTFVLASPTDAGAGCLELVASNAAALSAFAATLSYDPQALSPVRVEITDSLGDASQRIELVTSSTPGIVELAAARLEGKAAHRAAESEPLLLARIYFARRPYAAERHASAAPALTDKRYKSPLIYYRNDGTLGWDYVNPGDYNQDGAVTPADLVPIGRYFRQSWPRNDLGDIRALVDGNGDGIVLPSDLSVIGQNLGARIDGYKLYGGADASFVPDDPSEQSGLPGNSGSGELLAAVDFNAAHGDRDKERLYFSVSQPNLSEGEALWVRPLLAGTQGSISSYVAVDGLRRSDSGIYGRDFAVTVERDGYVGAAKLERICARVSELNGETVLQSSARGMEAMAAVLCTVQFDPLAYDDSGSDASGIPGGAQFRVTAHRKLGHLLLGGVLLNHNDVQLFPAQAQGSLRLTSLLFVPGADSPNSTHAGNPPIGSNSESDLQWNTDSDLLHWEYRNNGDYNQDGSVGTEDIIPWAAYQDVELTEPFRSVIDGNYDSKITVQDLTPLGVSFQRRISGYYLFISQDPEDYPWPAAGLDSPAFLADFSFDEALGDRVSEPLYFEYEYDLQPDEFAWVVPYDGTATGVYSSIAAWPGFGSSFEFVEDVPFNPGPVYILHPGDSYTLRRIDATDGDVSLDPATVYESSDPTRAEIVVGVTEVQLNVPLPATSGPLVLTSTYQLALSLNCQVDAFP